MQLIYQDFLVRDWHPVDRAAAAEIIADALAEHGLGWEPAGADRDVLEVEQWYLAQGGQFWVVERQSTIVGTSAFYPTQRGHNAVELRKMYLHPTARGQGLGRFLLAQLEQTIHHCGYQEIWLETATVLKSATILYEQSGYQLATGVETSRCDRVYYKALL
jgi:putative acetyltransferase